MLSQTNWLEEERSSRALLDRQPHRGSGRHQSYLALPATLHPREVPPEPMSAALPLQDGKRAGMREYGRSLKLDFVERPDSADMTLL